MVSNVIPETAVLQGTLRTFDNEIKQFLITRIKEIVENIANAFHAKSTVDVLMDIPVLCCDEKRNEEIAQSLQAMNAELHIISGLHTTGSDDFAVFANEIPSSYFMIGAKADSDKIYAHHNPNVCFHEDVLPIETAVYACVAINWT